jgi:hypothetical protein
MPIPIEVSGDVPQGNTCLLYFILYDYDGTTPVSVDNIITATMTLYDHSSGAVINSRTNVNVKGSFNQTGIFSHLLTADDNQIQAQNEKLTYEKHVAVLTVAATGATDAITFKREFWITIINQQHVPNLAP